jgi:hypothetical protein
MALEMPPAPRSYDSCRFSTPSGSSTTKIVMAPKCGRLMEKSLMPQSLCGRLLKALAMARAGRRLIDIAFRTIP